MDAGCPGEGRSHLLPLVDRELAAHRERLVPRARGDERVDLAEEGELPVAVADATGLSEPVPDGGDRLVVAVELGQLVGEVVHRPQARRRLVVLGRRADGVAEERECLLPAAAAHQDDCLRRQGLDEHLRQYEVFGHLERGLDPLRAEIRLATEEEEPPKLRGQRGEIGVRLVLRQQLERLVHALEAILEPSRSHNTSARRAATLAAGCVASEPS